MPRGDGTGPDGKGPKSTNKGWPEPRRDGSCRRTGGAGNRMGGHSKKRRTDRKS